jgi:hypothetical protein
MPAAPDNAAATAPDCKNALRVEFDIEEDLRNPAAR